MMRKIVTVLLVFVAAVSMLFAGGGGQQSQGASTGQAARITVQVFDRGTDAGKSDPTNNEWTNWIKAKVLKDENIAVSFVPVPRWEEGNILNTLMAAGTPPDVCISYSDTTNFRDQGGLVDLAPYINTLLGDLNKFLGPDPALPGKDLIRRSEIPETGRVYTLPARRINRANFNVWIRGDWLNKLGLGLPTTPEEYYNALKSFKERDPGGVGQNRVIPLILGTTNLMWQIQTMIDPFIDPSLSTKEFWINTVLDRHLLLPGFKEGVRFFNRLYNEGLIDQDFPLHRSESDLSNPIKAGLVGSYEDSWDGPYRESNAVLSDLQRNVPGANIVPIDPFTTTGRTYKAAYDAAGAFYFVPAVSKNPEAAVRYINWLSKLENYSFLQIGPEGVTHDMVDGVPKLKAATGLWIQNSPQNIDYTLPMNGLELGNEELNIRALASGYPWSEEIMRNAYNVAMHNARPDPVFSVALSAAGPVSQILSDKANIILTDAIRCAPADFDRVWDAGIRDWLASGAQTVIDERRAKYPN
ncbi:MAG: extracellular solute-binding protein [Spirochaetaceae bacterium]|jgi:putative aldouronate transport system substrate-binding protein|nr:extracellular solute-binding protein [Spirochaetaceae bacterium]